MARKNGAKAVPKGLGGGDVGAGHIAPPLSLLQHTVPQYISGRLQSHPASTHGSQGSAANNASE